MRSSAKWPVHERATAARPPHRLGGEGRGVRYSNRIVESYSAETCVLACRRGSSFVVKELIRASRKGRYDKVEIAKPKEYVDLLDKEVDLHG